MPSSLKSISIDIEVQTTDRLRKVVFGLDKETAEGGDVKWTIAFSLFEREKKTDEFGEALVKFDAVLVKAANFAQAETVAKKGKMTAPQVEHVLGTASVTAKRFKDGKTTQEKAEAAVERTLSKVD
jgi:hypothetical protein